MRPYVRLLRSPRGGCSEDPHPSALPERPLRKPRLGARKTPHRFRPKTPESASPLGEGEDRRPLDWIETKHICYSPGREQRQSRPGGRGALGKGLPEGEGERTAAALGTTGQLQGSPQGEGARAVAASRRLGVVRGSPRGKSDCDQALLSEQRGNATSRFGRTRGGGLGRG